MTWTLITVWVSKPAKVPMELEQATYPFECDALAY